MGWRIGGLFGREDYLILFFVYVYMCVYIYGGGWWKRDVKKRRRDLPNSATPVTVSMVGAARMVLLK